MAHICLFHGINMPRGCFFVKNTEQIVTERFEEVEEAARAKRFSALMARFFAEEAEQTECYTADALPSSGPCAP